MSSEVSLHKLVKVLDAKRTSARVFAPLLKQLLRNGTIPDQELVESLIELPNSGDVTLEKRRLEYTMEYVCFNAANLQQFMELLSQLTLRSQKAYLVYFKNNYRQLFKLNNLKEFVNSGLIPYTAALARKLGELAHLDPLQTNVWTHTIFLWGSVIDHHRDIIVLAQFKELAVAIMSVFHKFSNPGLSSFFTKKANLLMDTADLGKDLQVDIVPLHATKPDQLSISSVKKSYSLNLHSKKVGSYLHLKKFVWLNSQFKRWQSENLVDSYVQFFSFSGSSLSDVILELVGVFFEGISVAIQLKESAYIVFNWKNFIASRLALQLKDSRALRPYLSAENLGEVIATTVAKFDDPIITLMKVGGIRERPYDLRKQFLRSCIYRKLATLEIFTKTFPEEADSMSLSLIHHETEQLSHIDTLTNELNNKLLNVNTEFTSLEESKLIDYLRSLPLGNLMFLEKKQKHLHKLVHNAVDTLIKEKSDEKLSRLMIAMATSLPVSNYVFFNDPQGPWGILNKLISYMDKQSFGVDDDDGNFQEMYSYFGMILSGIIALVVFFGVDLELIDIEDSYTINFINKFFYRHCDDLTSKAATGDEDESTIVSNYNNLLQDWVNALFDVNNEGLSDDLIKSIDVKQTYKLITIIFQQAISANIVGTLSASGLDNGLDYLSQNFLAPCSLEIMKWILTRIGPLRANSEAMLQFLLRIIEINVGTTGDVTEPNYSFRVLLNIIGPETVRTIHSLKNWKSIDSATKVIAILQKELDPEYTAEIGPHPDQSGTYDLSQTIKQTLLHFVREPPSPARTLAAWGKISGLWAKLAHEQCLYAFFKELQRCLQQHASHVDIEESKIFLDFLVFLIIASSGQKFSDLYPPPPEHPAPALASLAASGPHAFIRTMDNHFASIFNEGTPQTPEAEPEKPKFDLMADFEMEDLFNDGGDDLFGDNLLHVLGPISRRPYSPPANIAAHHRNVAEAVSVLAYIEKMVVAGAQSDGAEKRFAAIAKLKLAQEIEQWQYAVRAER